MYKSKEKNIKLGLFVLVGMILFVFVIYFLGTRQNLFSSSTSVHSVFKNVDGLREGNVVRFAGIDVGMVKAIEIVTDSTVKVTLVISGKAQQFIKKDSKVTIGSEGLIGNKLINVAPGNPNMASISSGDILPVSEPVTVDDAISMLTQTGENLSNILIDIEEITKMIKNGEGLLGSLISDPALSDRISNIVHQFHASSNNFRKMTGDISDITSSLKQGEGTLGKLVSDNDIAVKIDNLLDSLQMAGSHALQSTKSLAEFADKLNSEDGLLGQLASDTALTEEIGVLLNNFNQAAKEINTTAEKINNSWLLNLFGGSRTNEAAKKE